MRSSMTRERAQQFGLNVALVVWLALALVAGCGASARQRTVNATLAATNAASAAFVTYDHQQQTRIVMDSPSKEAGQVSLAAYRAKQLEVESMFAAAYKAIAAAAVADDDPSLATMTQAALLLSHALHDLGVQP